MGEESENADLTPVLEMLANVGELCTTMLDAAAGYRMKAVEAGFSEEAAEQIALHYSLQPATALMPQMFGSTT